MIIEFSDGTVLKVQNITGQHANHRDGWNVYTDIER